MWCSHGGEKYRWLSSVLLHGKCLQVGINISKKRTASFFKAEDVGSMFLQNVGTVLQFHTISQRRD